MANPRAEATPLSVAICIGTYNQAQYLPGSISSALNQSYPIREIWVSDDASTDGTAQVMQEICRVHPEINFCRQPRNLGLPGNLSWLLAQPNTDLIVRLDSDDRLEPRYVEVLTPLMQRYPEAGFAHCDVFELDDHDKKTRLRRLAARGTFESGDEALRRNAAGFRVAANCLMYRRDALKDSNYYYPNLTWRYSEDWDLCLRLAIAGWGNVYAPEPLANYRVWTDAGSARARKKLPEVATTLEIYRSTLEPEYRRRGWDTAALHRAMRARAQGFAESLDSPLFTAAEKAEYKSLLREMGCGAASVRLSIALAENGFSPLMRASCKAKIGIKDAIKRLLHSVTSHSPGRT